MESSNLTAWQKLVCVCVRTRKKEMEGGNGCRREEEEVAGCEQSECLERRVIFLGGGGAKWSFTLQQSRYIRQEGQVWPCGAQWAAE